MNVFDYLALAYVLCTVINVLYCLRGIILDCKRCMQEHYFGDGPTVASVLLTAFLCVCPILNFFVFVLLIVPAGFKWVAEALDIPIVKLLGLK